MTLVRLSANQVAAASPDSLVEQMAQRLLFDHIFASQSERMSWKRSLPALAMDLVAAGLGDLEMLIEYQLPLSSQRADVVLTGAHPSTGEPSYVVVELKQWSSAHTYEGEATLVSIGGVREPRLHPVTQVRGYCRYINDFVKSVAAQPDALAGVAYLHNATKPGAVTDLYAIQPDSYGQLFTAADKGEFQAYLRSRLTPDAGAAADQLLTSAVGPSKQLLKLASDEIRHREQFTLLGNQQLAVTLVMHAVKEAHRSNRKRAVVVTGGPGSGKSVIALSLLGELSREGRGVLHATGSRSFTTTLRQVAGHRSKSVQNMFKYFHQFMAAEPNSLDVLILDEAHRIRNTSVSRFTKAELRGDRPQVDELLAAARVPVFLLDQYQIVRPGELGSLEQITRHADTLGIDVQHIDLASQFRCGGSATYIDWVHSLLGLSGGAPVRWKPDGNFVVRVADTPQEMELYLADKIAQGYSARITAGYCWPWSDPRTDGSLVRDVQLDGWARPWNSKEQRRRNGVPPAALWATEDGGFDQVGCIYTAQGFEFDWSGVIIGPDLVARSGLMKSDRSANRDPDFRNIKTTPSARFDVLVRHVYKVLLTRGMQGVVLYSPDGETRELLRELIR